MAYWTQLWSAATLNAAVGKCGGAVLTKTPIKMYTTMKRPFALKSAFI
jgi:hypothetical protein